jgi:hypothetical protein
MKAPVLGLSIAVAAFAASSLYLWQQLELERERSAQVAETTRQLNQRVAELESTRRQSMQLQASNGTTISGVFGAGPAPKPGASAASGPGAAGVEPGRLIGLPHERPPAMDKMLRWQIRADHKRMYADVGSVLGLSKEKSARLIDLLTEQQLGNFGSLGDSPWSLDPAEARRRLEEAQRANDAAIEELLGPEKAQSLREYQQSLPARREFEMLVQQLEGNDVTLTPEQNRQLLAAYLEERKRVPMPQLDAADPKSYHQAYTDWQNDYSARVAAEARNILDTTQLGAFNEVQELQREMRSQFQSVTFNADPAVGVALPANAIAVRASAGEEPRKP